MESRIRTYKKRPNCEVPDCLNEGWILVANRWICGECCKNWADAQEKKKRKANEKMFKEVMKASK